MPNVNVGMCKTSFQLNHKERSYNVEHSVGCPCRAGTEWWNIKIVLSDAGRRFATKRDILELSDLGVLIKGEVNKGKSMFLEMQSLGLCPNSITWTRSE